MADQHDDDAPESPGAPGGARPSRQSVRPSAFGPPRASEPPPAPDSLDDDDEYTTDEYTPDEIPDSVDELDPYELTPSSSPTALELVTDDLFSQEASADTSDAWTPLGTRQNVFPTLGYDPFRGSDSQASALGEADPDSEELSVPSLAAREFEETEVTSPSLVAARSGLLPIPEAPPEHASSGAPDESGVGPLSLVLFGLMLLGAAGVMVAQWPRGEAARETPPESTQPVAARPAPAAIPPVQPVRRVPAPLAADTPQIILAKIEPGLPEEAADAAHKLLAYADTYREEKRPEVADVLLAHALALDPRNEVVLLALVELALSRDDLSAAQKHAEQAVEVAPRSLEARVALGDVYARQGRSTRARRHWRRAGRLDPESEAVRSRLDR